MAAPVPTPIATAEAPFMLPPDDPERPEARAEPTEAEIGERDLTTT